MSKRRITEDDDPEQEQAGATAQTSSAKRGRTKRRTAPTPLQTFRKEQSKIRKSLIAERKRIDRQLKAISKDFGTLARTKGIRIKA